MFFTSQPGRKCEGIVKRKFLLDFKQNQRIIIIVRESKEKGAKENEHTKERMEATQTLKGERPRTRTNGDRIAEHTG